MFAFAALSTGIFASDKSKEIHNAGLSEADWPYGLDWIVRLIDKRAQKPGPRGPYKPRNSN